MLYFEADNGTGLCDGFGGASKWMDYVRHGHINLTAAECVAYGHLPGKVTYLEVPKGSRTHLAQLINDHFVTG